MGDAWYSLHRQFRRLPREKLKSKKVLYDVAFRKRALLFVTRYYWAPDGPIVQEQFSV